MSENVEEEEVDMPKYISNTVESFGQEVDQVLEEEAKEANCFFQSPIAVLKKKGFTEGAVMKRTAPDILPGVYKYGIFTGDFSTDDYGNIQLKFTDNEICHVAHCELITDVDKYLFQYIAEEKSNLVSAQERLFHRINEHINNVLYTRD